MLLGLASIALVGCSTTYDSRLNGSWRSNREETVAEAFRQDPRWLQAPHEKVERFKDLFGNMTVTYSNSVITTSSNGNLDTMHYEVVKLGEDFVVIRTKEGVFRDKNMRIDFAADGGGYWIDNFGILPREKFDKVSAEPDSGGNR